MIGSDHRRKFGGALRLHGRATASLRQHVERGGKRGGHDLWTKVVRGGAPRALAISGSRPHRRVITAAAAGMVAVFASFAAGDDRVLRIETRSRSK
jgi:hypothetical protein